MAAASDEIHVNTQTRGSQRVDAVEALADGGWVVVWTSEVTGSTNVYAQRFAADGSRTGGEFLVKTVNTYTQSDAQIAALTDGGFVVTWTDQDLSGTGVYAQRYSASGAAVGGEFRANTAVAGYQDNPTIVGLPDGGFLIGWEDVNGATQQRYDANGAAVGANIALASGSLGPRYGVMVDGSYAALWSVPNSGLFMQTYSAAGAPVSAVTRIGDAASQDLSVAGLPGGGFVATWSDSNGKHVLAQRFAADGSPVGSLQTVDTSVSEYLDGPRVDVLADGGYIIVWDSYTKAQSYNSVGQRFAADGSRVGGETLFNLYTSGMQYGTSVAALNAGGYVVVWTSAENPGDPTSNDLVGVFSRVFTFAGTSITGTANDDTINVTQAALAGTTSINGLAGHDVITTADAALDLSGITLTSIEAITSTNAVGTYFIGSAGDDHVIGAGRYDTMGYSGVHLDYAITGNLAATSVTGIEGHDTLDGVEQQNFLDGRLIHDVESAAAMIYRYYAIGLDRAPDTVGLDNWLHLLENRGLPLEIAKVFASSQEFANKYGALDNTAFVTALYNDGLDRAPDTHGLNGWVAYLNSGGDRAYVFMGFANSMEAMEHTRAVVEAGVWALDFDAGIVARMFDGAFERNPERVEFEHYMERLDDGASYSVIAAEMAATSEFVTLYGGLSNADYIDALYLNALGRAADPAGKQSWIDQISLGMTRGDVFFNIANSAEHQVRYAPTLEHGVVLDDGSSGTTLVSNDWVL